MTNQNLQLTEDQLKQKATEYDKMLTRGLYENLLLLKGINDEKLYLYLGFESLEDYCKDRWDMAKQTMYHYLNVATKFLPQSPEVSPGRLFELGIAKMKILAVLEPDTRQELAVKGELKLGGTTYTIQEIKDMNVQTLRELVTGKKEEKLVKQMDIPFPKVYDNAEKYFTKIMNDVIACSRIIQPDKVKIRIAIEGAIQVFEMYKKMEA